MRPPPQPLTPGGLLTLLTAVKAAVDEMTAVQRRTAVPRERVVGTGPVVVAAYRDGWAFEGRGETLLAAAAACRVALGER